MIRATIMIRQPDPEAAPEEGGYIEEWTHSPYLEKTELGVEINWGAKSTTFVPWQSVVRIDYSECHCSECRQAA